VRVIVAALAATAMAAAVPAVPAQAHAVTRAEIVQMIHAQWGPTVGPTAVAVAHCESRLDPGATHRNRNGTRDWGLFQLNDGGTLQGLGLTQDSALDAKRNIEAAWRLYRSRGWQPWVCIRLIHRKGR
jgi:hypothetical protein